MSRGGRGKQRPGDLALRVALTPLSMVYGGVAACRRGAYSAGLLPSHRVGAPVVSVGGLTLGGSGKTPVTRFLADRLAARGLCVGVVHGGYLGLARHRVSCLDPSLRWRSGAARIYGDEAVLLAGWLEGSIVTCGADKLEAARLAVSHGAQLVLVDDGFQHLRLHRDLNILLGSDDEDVPPLPAGRGREFPSAAGAAHLRWGVDRGDGQSWEAADISSRLRPRLLLRADGSSLCSASALEHHTVYLMAGVARPEAFARSVGSLGARILGSAFVRDHHRFTASQFRAAARSGADLVLCTEKDAARMYGHPEASALTTLTSAIEIIGGEPLLERNLNSVTQGLALD